MMVSRVCAKLLASVTLNLSTVRASDYSVAEYGWWIAQRSSNREAELTGADTLDVTITSPRVKDTDTEMMDQVVW